MTVALHTHRPDVTVDDDLVAIEGLSVEDRPLAELLRTAPEADRGDLARRALTVGARGLLTMGIGLDIGRIDEQIGRTITRIAGEVETRMLTVIEDGHQALTRDLDPALATSALARARDQLAAQVDQFAATLDPDQIGSPATRFLDELTAAIGPEGSLDARLAEALDPDADGSAVANLAAAITSQIRDLRDAVIREEGVSSGRADEASRGTVQGLDFEDEVDAQLRSWAARRGGCVVERTGRDSGDLGPGVVVGDFVVTLPGGTRVVVEAKNQATIGLSGSEGILAELDRAMANRNAQTAVCISRRDAFPAEVGVFGAYDSRVLAVDEGDGAMTAVAMEWALTVATSGAETAGREIDTAALANRLATIRRLAEGLRSARAAAAKIRSGVESLHERLGDLRIELLDEIADAERDVIPFKKRENEATHS